MVKTLFLLLVLVTLAPAKTLRDLPYAGKKSHPYQKLDLFIPDEAAAKPRPVFILIHGGGWAMGDKSTSSFVEPKTTWLMKGGYLVASINYRLAPAAKHPAQVEDVLKSVAWVQKHVARHGGDPQRIYLLGHSAGAHLAALAAVDSERQKAAGIDAKSIRGVILLDGAGYDIPRQYPALREGGYMQKIYHHAFTTDPAAQRDASPVHRVTTRPPPFLILHVARRADSRLQSNLLADALREKGGEAKVIPIPDKTHATINADCGKKDDPVTKAIVAFLSR